MRLTKHKDQWLHQCWLFYRSIEIPPHPERDCWLWQGPVNGGPGNYGYIYYQGRKHLAHRFSWQIHHNRSIPEGKVISHLCNQPQCVSPHHLELATQKQNMAHMIQSGREQFGRKLSARDVAQIRRSRDRGVELARRFGVSASTITRIRKYKYK